MEHVSIWVFGLVCRWQKQETAQWSVLGQSHSLRTCRCHMCGVLVGPMSRGGGCVFAIYVCGRGGLCGDCDVLLGRGRLGRYGAGVWCGVSSLLASPPMLRQARAAVGFATSHSPSPLIRQAQNGGSSGSGSGRSSRSGRSTVGCCSRRRAGSCLFSGCRFAAGPVCGSSRSSAAAPAATATEP